MSRTQRKAVLLKPGVSYKWLLPCYRMRIFHNRNIEMELVDKAVFM